MLSSITPLGERGRHMRWGVTVTSFALASAAAGAGMGALAAFLGGLVAGSRPTPATTLALGGALLLAPLLDARTWGLRPPGPSRQVNENWLAVYRGWVYGAGFGAQLGAGVLTIVPTAAIYVFLLAAFASGQPALGLALGACFGVVRAAPLLAGRRVHEPAQLFDLHRRLARWRRPLTWATVAIQLALLLVFVSWVAL